MYTSFFGLHEKPFAITPDPRYLFMSERHREALAHLIYGVREMGGFMQLTGEVGTGKTTLVRSLLQQTPETADVALILNPQLSRVEFLTTICEELGVQVGEARGSIKALVDGLNAFLLANHGRGRRTILIVDEAQNLLPDVLEQVRLLTNLETAKQKLLQIILIGQPELRTLLARNDMRQLAQRITGRYHLEPLSREEAVAYIDHRVKVAGGVGQLFEPKAKREIFRLARGVPRMINVIADRALLGAFTLETRQVTAAIVRQAATEVYGGRRGLQPALRTALAAVTVLVIGGGAALLASRDSQSPAGAARSGGTAAVRPVTRAAGPVERPVAAEDVGALLAAAPSTDVNSAFVTLFQLWGVTYTAQPDGPCKAAEGYRLNCLFQHGTLDEVRTLNTPVILSLRDRRGVEHQAVLTGLAADVALVDLGGRRARVAASDLAAYWNGDYQLVWRPQTSELKAFVPGMRDPDVRWLRSSLATIQGEPVAPMGSDLYDANLESRVKSYQRDHRLNPDGLVSHQTQIAIIADLKEADTPRLAAN
jgi:general secretion pathway protein A